MLAPTSSGPSVSTIQYTAKRDDRPFVLLRQMVFSTLSTEEISNSAVTISPQVPTAVILLELATNRSSSSV